MLLFERDKAHSVSSARDCLGYVSQADVVPADLRARQAVQFSACLRELHADDDEVESVLRQVEIPEEDCDSRPAQLSGGQRKRMRIAAELIARPRLLIMDEPASGLDRNRESSLLRLLRTLRCRGCTIIVITHNLRSLDWFDRVYVVRKDAETGRGRIGFGRPPADLRRLIPSGDLDDLDFIHLPIDAERSVGDAPPTPSPDDFRGHGKRDLGRQITTLLKREMCYLGNATFKRLVLPLAIVPFVFASAIGLGVRPSDQPLLGFLSILACIWMSASLSLMAIVDEREVYEHERLLFLRNDAYVLSKALISCLLSAIQTSVFVAFLWAWRELIPHSGAARSMLYDPVASGLVLVLVGWSATTIGLFISAAAGHSKSTATLLLPLFMMAQIVFSVLIGDPKSATNDGEADQTYKNYSLATPESVQSPGLFARAASCLTLSRHADRAPRSFAYVSPADSRTDNPEPPEQPVLAESIAVLLSLTALFAVATWGCLGLQNRWESIRRRFQTFAARSDLVAKKAKDVAKSKVSGANT